MKIALLGYGKMGKAVEQVAKKKNHEIVGSITVDQKNWDKLERAEIFIDFSHPECVLEHVEKCIALKKNLLIGTTGWGKLLEKIKKMTIGSEIGVLYSPNFSIGLQLFLRILQFSGKLMNHFNQYDVAGFEIHHNEKKDAPSGSALEMSRILESNIDRKSKIDFASIRVGSEPGKHVVLFDSLYDTISLSHEVRNRETFALGAVEAAEWLFKKKGFFTMEDFMNEVSDGS